MAQPQTRQRTTILSSMEIAYCLPQFLIDSSKREIPRSHSSISKQSQVRMTIEHGASKQEVINKSQTCSFSDRSQSAKQLVITQSKMQQRKVPQSQKFKKTRKQPKRAEKSQRQLKRVAAGSCVNFQHLTEEEQIQRFHNMRCEYYKLKKAIKRMAEDAFNSQQSKRDRLGPLYTSVERDYLQAQKRLSNREYEIPDSKDVPENLAQLLASRKMNTSSLEFGLLTSIVRRVTNRLKLTHLHPVEQPAMLFLDSVSKQRLIEFFTGIQVDRDLELQGLVMQLDDMPGLSSRKSEVQRFNIPEEEKLNAANLKRFNQDHQHTRLWE